MAEEKKYGEVSEGNAYAGKMSDVTLSDAKEKANSTTNEFYQKHDEYSQKQSALEAADKEYQDALLKSLVGMPSKETTQKLEETRKEKEKAKEELKQAQTELEASAQAAQDAQDQLEAKTAENEAARPNDTTYVVHMATSVCKNFGLRPSKVGLTTDHGVYTKMLPNLTATDQKAMENILNFGGCHSVDNPSTWAAAEEAAAAARETIKENENIFQKIVGFFQKKPENQVDESLVETCLGECTPVICAGNWSEGHEKVTINGSPVLLRRCELTCLYGGTIILETSGQPE